MALNSFLFYNTVSHCTELPAAFQAKFDKQTKPQNIIAMNLEEYVVAPTPKGGEISEEAMVYAKPNNPILELVWWAFVFLLPAVFFLNKTYTLGEKIFLYLAVSISLSILTWISRRKYSSSVYFGLDKNGLHFYSQLTDATLPDNLSLDVNIGHKIKGSDKPFVWQEIIIPLNEIREIKFDESLNEQFGNDDFFIITIVRQSVDIFAKERPLIPVYLALNDIQRDQLNWILEAGNVMLSFLNGKRLEKPEESIPIDEIDLDSDFSPNDDSPADKSQNA